MVMIVDEKIGGVTLRIVTHGNGYRGALIRKGKPNVADEDSELTALHARLRNEAGKLHPDYLGMDGAVARFLHFFPGGFDDPAFINERGYKAKARQRLSEMLSLDAALTATPAQAAALRAAFGNTNLLHSTEFARAHDVLRGESGVAYVRAAARVALGEIEAGLAGMAAAILPHGRASWPLLTYFPSHWRPDDHMFLKPEATLDYARRVGDPYQFAYSAEPRAAVYAALLALVAATERVTATLGARDRTDVQSFIWVVGAYKESDMKLLDKLRAA